MPRIVITGPESTGKTILSEQLAKHFSGIVIKEYAREYFEIKKTYLYDFEDVEKIANAQYQSYLQYENETSYVFFDTYLIITKIWFEWVYGLIPIWLHKAIVNSKIDLYLLCDLDIEWIPDPLRTNGGEKRLLLFQCYKRELDYYKKKYFIISGIGDERFQNALRAIEMYKNSIE